MTLRRITLRALPVGLSILLASSFAVGTAQAAQPNYMSDPEFRALSAASVYTQGLTGLAVNIDFSESRTYTQGGSTFEMSAEGVFGINQYNGEGGLKVTFKESGGGVTPEPVARTDVFADRSISALTKRLQSSGLAIKTTPPPNPPGGFESVSWYGFNYDLGGTFQNIDRRNLGPVELKALRLLGASDAEFFVDREFWDGPNPMAEMGYVGDSLNPGYFLRYIVEAEKASSIEVGDITSAPGENNTTIYTVPITVTNEGFAYDILFTANEDNVITDLNYDIALEDQSYSVSYKIADWGSTIKTAAQPDLNSIVVERGAYIDMVNYLYSVDEMKFAVKNVASQANTTAFYADVAVTPRMVQRIARDNLGFGSYYLLANTKRGVRVSLAEYPLEAKCEITVVQRMGKKQAVTRCGQANFVSPSQPPGEVTPMR